MIRVLACGVFRPALEHLQLKTKYPDVQITYLPSVLHLRPQELKSLLLKEIKGAQACMERVICLYGECFPDITTLCEELNVTKVPGSYCYEIFLGPERFNDILNEMAGTYFVERDLITNFEEHCVEPLELHDEIIRRYCFEHYRRLLYVRQPEDPDLVTKATEIADFLQLMLDIRDADYSFLEDQLANLIESAE